MKVEAFLGGSGSHTTDPSREELRFDGLKAKCATVPELRTRAQASLARVSSGRMRAMPLIYLVRHGIADDRSLTGRDEDRVLSQEGADKMRRATAGLASLKVELDAIASSPLRRAQQTAEIVRAALAPGLEFRLDPQLRPESDVELTLKQLQAAPGTRALMLVGHEPSISALAALLLTGSPHGARLPFKPGSVVAIELANFPPAGLGTLRWFMTPEQLACLSASSV